MNPNLKDYAWVFVGCGGTFYAASPYLAVLVRRYCRRPIILFDPDTVEQENLDRQWPWAEVGDSKVRIGSRALRIEDFVSIVDCFKADDSVLEEATDGRPVLAIVNVDNNEARLDVAAWLASRISPGIMVVSGCEQTLGQCYAGLWDEGEAILDWRTLHPDVGDTTVAPVNSCNIQTIQSNALTGVLVGMCIEEIARWLQYSQRKDVSEYYWDIDKETGRVKMWELLVETKREVLS